MFSLLCTPTGAQGSMPSHELSGVSSDPFDFGHVLPVSEALFQCVFVCCCMLFKVHSCSCHTCPDQGVTCSTKITVVCFQTPAAIRFQCPECRQKFDSEKAYDLSGMAQNRFPSCFLHDVHVRCKKTTVWEWCEVRCCQLESGLVGCPPYLGMVVSEHHAVLSSTLS